MRTKLSIAVIILVVAAVAYTAISGNERTFTQGRRVGRADFGVGQGRGYGRGSQSCDSGRVYLPHPGSLAATQRGRGRQSEGQGQGANAPRRGMGQMTLSEFCQNEGIELTWAIGRLRDEGFAAQGTMTIREIADGAGVHPRELRGILGLESDCDHEDDKMTPPHSYDSGRGGQSSRFGRDGQGRGAGRGMMGGGGAGRGGAQGCSDCDSGGQSRGADRGNWVGGQGRGYGRTDLGVGQGRGAGRGNWVGGQGRGYGRTDLGVGQGRGFGRGSQSCDSGRLYLPHPGSLAATQRGLGRQGGGQGQGANAPRRGMGQMTLSEFCQNEGVELTWAIRRLRNERFAAQGTMTIREIADGARVHPRELRDILGLESDCDHEDDKTTPPPQLRFR